MQKPTTAATSPATSPATSTSATSTSATSATTPAGYTFGQELARRHAWRVQMIPWDVLPPVNPARHALQRLAAAGASAYALGAEDGYLIAVQGRWYTPEQWMAHHAAHADEYAAMIASAESAAGK